jgi:polar amino acid transport system substrate-binding protein
VHPRLRRLATSLACLPLLLLAACGPGDAPRADAGPAGGDGRDFGGRTVTFAVENGYIPFNFIRTDTREAVGWDYDMAAELGRRLNFTPRFREIAWDSMIQGVSGGQFDIAGNGITITEERARVVEFSVPYMEVRQRLLVRADENRFADLATFSTSAAGRIGAQKGNTNYTTAEKLAGPARVVSYDGFGELIQALLTGDIDAVIVDDIGGQGYLGVHRDRLKLLAGDLPGQSLGYIFPQGSALRPAVDRTLEEMRADGTLAAIKARWFSPGFVPPGAPAP